MLSFQVPRQTLPHLFLRYAWLLVMLKGGFFSWDQAVANLPVDWADLSAIAICDPASPTNENCRTAAQYKMHATIVRFRLPRIPLQAEHAMIGPSIVRSREE